MWLRDISKSESMIRICDQVMAGLSCFPWNGSNCTVHDMAILLSDSWLSDFHIDYTLTKITHYHHTYCGAEASSHHVLLPVFDLDSIAKAYKGTKNFGHAADKRRQLLEVENEIISGHIDSVGGVLHLHNHWTSLVIQFKPPRILYGDSLGNSMPPKKASSFQRWICHMLTQSGHQFPESDISIYSLATTIQQDPNSCGLFALNAISHHYLSETSPLLKPDALSLAQYRMEIALELLQEGTVSQFPH